jgi:hypothetical protein
MTEHANSIARQVHAFLLEALPEANNVDLIKAAHLTEAAGVPGDHFQMETFVDIRNFETAIENGAGASELEPLLMRAIGVALRWVTA